MFLKKKGPIDVPGGLILLPMFAAHPYNHFCTEYPPGGGNLYSEVDIMLEYGSWNSKWTLNWNFGSTQKATQNKDFDKFFIP